MYEDRYEMTEMEKKSVALYLDVIATYGKLIRHNAQTGQPVMDNNGQAVVDNFSRIAGSPTLQARYIIDSQGVVWPFKANGSSRCPHLADGGGSRCRSDYVEMWTGGWHKRKIESTGQLGYAKTRIEINMDSHVQGHPNTSKIEWMKQTKGYKHPLADPQSPTQMQLDSLESRNRSAAPQIFAQTQQELSKSGLDKAPDYIAEAQKSMADKLAPVAPVLEPERRPDPAPEPAPPATADVRISDDARALAETNSIDLSTVVGTGSKGRIVIGDIRALIPGGLVKQGRSNKK